MKLLRVLFAFTIVFTVCAQTPPPTPDDQHKPDNKTPFPAPKAEESSVKTQHSIHINGQDLHYTAIAGTLVLKKNEGDGDPAASIFFVAYTQDGSDAAKRPITFAFNGGPGSSSVWLHMGALGPKRVVLTSEGMAVAPPYRIVDNEQTALSYTDLVFIDPVTTGFSRHAPGEDPKQFHGVEEDLKSVSEFIRLYLSKFQRWNSPKFLAGESYGTTRAAGLSKTLLDEQGIYLNGITLISSVLNFGTLSPSKGNDLPYVMFLPTYAATAWYHKKLGPELQARDVASVVDEVRHFSGADYEQALFAGDKLPEDTRRAIVEKLSMYTGLSSNLIEQLDLRIPDDRFFKELLRGERELIGRYDSRVTSYSVDPGAEHAEYDPSYASVQGAFTAAFNDYVRSELNYKTDLPYNILTAKVWPWNFTEFSNGFVDVSTRLADAITQNPFMHVLQMNGYYDLATPFFATEYTFNHMNLAPALRGNVSYGYCGAGHMLYLKQSCLEELHKDMANMYTGALGTH